MIKIDSKKKLNEFLKVESKNYNLKRSGFPIFGFSEDQVLYRFNYLLRKLEYYTNCNKKIRKLITKLIYIHYQRKYLMFIPINSFDIGLRFIHIGPRMVNGSAVVGKNFIMHMNTCIVAGGNNDISPIIGDNVIMGISSIVLGEARVGNNTAIGAGAVVNKDFSEGNMTIAGVPAKKISNNTRESWKKENRKKISANEKN